MKSRIYFYYSKKGIGYIEKENITFLNISQLIGLNVTKLVVDSAENIYIGTHHEGFIYLEKGKDPLIMKTENSVIYDLCFISKNKILIATSKGLYIFNGRRIVRDSDYSMIEGKKVYCILNDSGDNLWFGTDYGAYQFVSEKEIFLFNETNGLKTPVCDIIEDKQQGIWFATNTYGVFRLNNRFLVTYTTSHGLQSNDIYGLISDKDGTIWIGTKKGIDIFKQGTLQKFLSNNSVSIPLICGTQNDIWVSHQKKGIYIWKNEQLIQHIPISKLTTEPSGAYFNAAIELTQKKMLLGGNRGIKLVNKNDGSIDNFITKKNLKNATVNALIQTHNKSIWIGTQDKGLFLLKGEEFMHFTTEDGLPSHTISCFTTDKDHNLWIGTLGGGIFKVRKSDIQYGFTHFDELALISKNIYSLFCDKNNDIWIGTNQGLNKIVIYQNDLIKVDKYTRMEGFDKLKIMRYNSIIGNFSNYLCVAVSRGISIIDLKKHIFSEKGPKVQITDVNLLNKENNWEDITDDLVPSTDVSQKVSLSSNQGNITIDFKAINQNIPHLTTYQWKLEGFEKIWTKPTQLDKVIYTNLPSGNYTFQVKAYNGGGACSQKPAEFKFTISQPFYQTRWFSASSLIITLAGIVIYARRRVRFMKEDQENLERQVQMRTTEIEAQKLRLTKALEEIDRKNHELVKVNKKITNNIVYSRKIQDVVIFSDDSLQNIFENSFAFLQCKAIVSSDFYWTWKTENTIFIAVVDCTAYGVPGAFMSLIGLENLKQILRKHEHESPSTILSKFNERITRLLSTKSKSQQFNEGMNTSICKIDKIAHRMTFSGANSRLIYIQKDKIHFIRGNFYSVGIQYSRANICFTDHLINLLVPTNIYLFSDGFYHQFGGKDKRKYTLSNFKKLLHTISKYDFRKQKELLQIELKRWKKNIEQTDDILVIGFQYNPAS